MLSVWKTDIGVVVVGKTNFSDIDRKVSAERVHKNIEKILARNASLKTGRYIPSQDSLTIGTGRFLTGTVLFLDICSFSEYPNDTEEQQSLMLDSIAVFFGEIIKIVEEFDGVVEKNTGDGLLAYFLDDHETHDSSAAIATACAASLFDVAINVLNPMCSTVGLYEFEFRVCIDSGRLTVARVGSAQRFNGIVAIGTTANIASKMLSVAGPREILIGENTFFQLPESWQKYAQLSNADVGATFTESGDAYRLIKYNGRWF